MMPHIFRPIDVRVEVQRSIANAKGQIGLIRCIYLGISAAMLIFFALNLAPEAASGFAKICFSAVLLGFSFTGVTLFILTFLPSLDINANRPRNEDPSVNGAALLILIPLFIPVLAVIQEWLRTPRD